MSNTKLSKIIIVIVILGINFCLLYLFDTLTWPSLWPYPLIPILTFIIVSALIFSEYVSDIWLFRIVGLAMVFIGECYLIHSLNVAITQPTLVSVLHAFGVTGMISLSILNYINQLTPRIHQSPPPLPDDLPYVAAVIPTYGEPVEILEKTAQSLLDLDYPREKLYIFISDDGHREEVEALTKQLGIAYNRGAKKDAKAGNLNSALEHIYRYFGDASLIITQDADELIDPSFLKKTVGFFQDPKMAFVQTPKEALAPAGDPFGVRDRIFYDVTQPGRNGVNAAFSCGSGVIWRIDAIQSIGGFATWNVVEDLTTSYFLHSAGWNSEYYPEILTAGLAPNDIPGLVKQRGTWAIDNFRLFLFKNPLFRKGLSIRQRLQYMELGLFFLNAVIFIPALMLVPIISLLTGDFAAIEGTALFPWLIVSLLYYYVFGKGDLPYVTIMLKYWVSHFYTYAKALWIAVRSARHKPSYKVTRKTHQDGFYGMVVWPQFLYLLVAIVTIIKGIFFMNDVAVMTRFSNILVIIMFAYFTSAICLASFHGVSLPRISWASLIGLQERTDANTRDNVPVPQTEAPLTTGAGD